MKKMILTLGVLALTSGLAAAQDVNELVPVAAYDPTAQAPGRSALDTALIANEHKVGDALMKKDRAAFTALVAMDGWSIDRNGAMKNSEMAASVDQLVIKNFAISDEKVT